MCIHDLTSEDFANMNEEQLLDKHLELTCEITSLSREISNYQRYIHTSTDLIEEIELELEAKEAANKGQVN